MGMSWFPISDESKVCPGVLVSRCSGQPAGWPRVVCPPLVVFNAGAYPVPHFCSWHFRSGSWAFWSFYILSTICPNCPYPIPFLVCYSFSVVSLRRLVSRCMCCSRVPGPRFQAVSIYVTSVMTAIFSDLKMEEGKISESCLLMRL